MKRSDDRIFDAGLKRLPRHGRLRKRRRGEKEEGGGGNAVPFKHACRNRIEAAARHSACLRVAARCFSERLRDYTRSLRGDYEKRARGPFRLTAALLPVLKR